MEQFINDWYILHYIFNPYILVNFSWMFTIYQIAKLIANAIRGQK